MLSWNGRDLACVHSVRRLLEQCVQFEWGRVQGRCYFLQDIYLIWLLTRIVWSVCAGQVHVSTTQGNASQKAPKALNTLRCLCSSLWLVWLQASEVTVWNCEIYGGKAMAGRHLLPVPTLELDVWGRACAQRLPGLKLPCPGCLRSVPTPEIQLCIQKNWEIQEIWVEVQFGSAFKIQCKHIQKSTCKQLLDCLTIRSTPIQCCKCAVLSGTEISYVFQTTAVPEL